MGRAANSSVIRSIAPAAFCTSPQTSPSADSEPAASSDRPMNCTSRPGLMWWVRTSWAPSHSTPTTPQNTKAITHTVSTARARSRPWDAS